MRAGNEKQVGRRLLCRSPFPTYSIASFSLNKGIHFKDSKRMAQLKQETSH